MEEATIPQLSAKMASGEITAVALTKYYLERIERLDRSGPTINSVIEVNPEALEIAAARDRERARGRVRGPLHGIPILLKENMDTRDRMQTTAGSLALEGSRARRDAFLVRRLRSAGAILLGKTNMSEWAGFRSNLAASGWSSRGGLTRNPYALDRTCCGSSSGSGAAVAASLCAAALGTETDGSIICPATMCGIVGLKPTLGLVSRSGIIPIAHSQDTAGPMARTMEDAAVLLGCIAGVDPDDRATRPSRTRLLRDYTQCLDLDGLKGARLGIARNMMGSNPRVIQIVESAIELMRQMGAVIVDPANLPNWNRYGKSEMEVLYYEFKADVNKYLAGLGPRTRVHSLDDVIRFNEENAERVMPYFGQDLMTSAQAKGPLTSPAYRRALARNRRLARQEGIDALIAKKRLDAIVTASGGPAWTIDLANGDPGGWDSLVTTPAAVAGYPHVTVPAGFVFGLPIGISFFSTAWREPTLLKIAYAFEQALGARRPPEFKPRADL